MSVVLITGCSSGFGLETALAFARRGDTTVATMRNIAKADSLLKRADDEGLTVHVETLDVLDEKSIDNAVTKVLHDYGTIDGLVNNAGVGSHGPIETQSIDNAMRLMDTNFWGPMRTIRAVLPTMREQRSGVIINVSSISGRVPGTIYEGMYGASKHALNALSEALAGEVEPFSIRVVSIEPGFFATEILTNDLSVDQEVSAIYAADQAWVRAFFDSSAGDAPGAEVVAAAIISAVDDPETPLHSPVGDDAAMYLDLMSQVDGYEGWMAAVTPMVEATVGPRPTPATT
jgi:NAD(P)-dependent dehydrogenase (short-subunit alcohol dehydrogenase family)